VHHWDLYRATRHSIGGVVQKGIASLEDIAELARGGVEKGFTLIPSTAGWGTDLDEDEIARHPWKA
jgi:hypothetical protein